jgi:hypothetical protein
MAESPGKFMRRVIFIICALLLTIGLADDGCLGKITFLPSVSGRQFFKASTNCSPSPKDCQTCPKHLLSDHSCPSSGPVSKKIDLAPNTCQHNLIHLISVQSTAPEAFLLKSPLQPPVLPGGKLRQERAFLVHLACLSRGDFMVNWRHVSARSGR